MSYISEHLAYERRRGADRHEAGAEVTIGLVTCLSNRCALRPIATLAQELKIPLSVRTAA